MEDWIFLALVGLITYLLLRGSVSRLSTVPWRILWLVVMAPPTIVVVGKQIFQLELPPLLILLLFLASYITFTVLLQRARLSAGPHRKEEESANNSPDSSSIKPEDVASPDKPATATEIQAAPVLDSIAAALAHTPISEVPKEQLNECFPWNVFYLQNVEYRPQAIICRGNLRVEPEEAYGHVRKKVEARFGNRFLLVLQEGLAGKPFFALVPNPAARRTAPLEKEQPALAIGLLIFTLWTTTTAGALAAGVDPGRVMEPQFLLQGLPYALALTTILAAYEITRFWMARRHRIQTSLPYFIPVPFALGTFGAFIHLKEPVPNRKVLFDISMAGPLAGSMMALVMLVAGLTVSTTTPAPLLEEGQPILMNFHEVDPSLSLLLGILAKILLGEQLQAGEVIDLHPLAVAGWLGLVVAAFNLMPVGQLDGGHLVHAVYGQQTGAHVGRITRILVLLLALMAQPWLWIWSILLFLISAADEPALNDVTDLNEGRDLLGLWMLTLLVLIILPIPPFLRVWMGLA